MAKNNICIRLPDDLVLWLEEMTKKRMFASKTHGIEYALAYLKSIYDKEGRLPPIE